MEPPHGVRLIELEMNRDLRGHLVLSTVAQERERHRNRQAAGFVHGRMEMLLAVLLALMIPALLTYLPPDL